MSQPQAAFTFKDFDIEEFLVKRLAEHRRQISAGVTDPALRRERIRTAIIEAGLECVIVGRAPGGRPETYAQAFERYYREPLQPSQRKGK
jgi:hypothetical protein